MTEKKEWDEFNEPWNEPEKKPEEKPEEPVKPQLHQSDMDTLSKCGVRYEFRRLKGIISPPGVALLVGTAVHKAAQADLRMKLESKFQDLMPIDDMQDLAAETLKKRWESEGCVLQDEEKLVGEKETRNQAINKAVRLAGVYHEDLAPHIMPTHVERKWVIELKGYPMDLSGQMDVQEVDSIRDLKTGSKAPIKTMADNSQQLTVYALAAQIIDGHMPERLLLDHCIQTPKKKKAYVATQQTFRTQADIQMLLNRLQCYITNIQKGAFIPANTSDWWCSPKWCGYHSICPYAKRPVSVPSAGIPNKQPHQPFKGL